MSDIPRDSDDDERLPIDFGVLFKSLWESYEPDDSSIMYIANDLGQMTSAPLSLCQAQLLAAWLAGAPEMLDSPGINVEMKTSEGIEYITASVAAVRDTSRGSIVITVANDDDAAAATVYAATPKEAKALAVWLDRAQRFGSETYDAEQQITCHP
jgi:hypothetical protein